MTQLAEVIPFPCAANEIAAIFDGLAAQARSGRITGVMFAILDTEHDTRQTITGWYGVDVADRAEMVTHMQYDVIDGMMELKLAEEDE